MQDELNPAWPADRPPAKMPSDAEVRAEIIRALRAGEKVKVADIAARTSGLTVPEVHNGGQWAYIVAERIVNRMVQAREIYRREFDVIVPAGQFPLEDR